MTDETRNLEVECAPANWDAPPPSADFHERMLSAYDREFRGAPLWRRCLGIRVPLPIAVAAVLGAFFLAFFIAPHFRAPIHRRSAQMAAATGHRYKPVYQPRFVVISRGEHP
jgi:hypothetical protein